MTRRQRAAKQARRAAHAARQDHRQPEHPFSADERRDAARDERRKARKAATAL